MDERKESSLKERICPACGRTITGRANKRYCDDNCRNNYYYHIYNEQLLLVRNVNAVLMRNRMILRTLNPFGKKTVTKQCLVDSDFDFNYFTGIRKTKKGRTYYIVYDQSYALADDNNVDVVAFKPQSLIRRMPASYSLEESCLFPRPVPFDDQCE